MKKLLLFVSITLLTISSASAQCTPDPQYTSPGIYPNEATGFVSGCVGVAYTQLVTNVVPVDTCVTVVQGLPCVTVDIDSIVITSFTGLPNGLNVVYFDGGNTNSPADQGCFEGGTTGCALISGTPTAAGSFTLTINVDAYAGGQSTPNPTVIDWYTIVIEDVPTISAAGGDLMSSSATGNQWFLDGNSIPSANGQTYTPAANGSYTVSNNCGTSAPYVVNSAGIGESALSNFNVYPNPAEQTITIDGMNGASFDAVSIVNLSGTVVKEINAISVTKQTIDISNLENGVYFVRVQTTSNIEVIRIVKK